jgi:tubulin-like protein CetZ
MFNLEKIGATRALLSPHLKSKEVQREVDRYPSQTVIGLGQGGGRIAAELSRFGFPTFLVNSSKSDMDEHSNLIPAERRIMTKSQDFPELEGTDKNAQLGFQIAKENQQHYKELAVSEEVQNADFVWVCVSLGGGTGNGALKVALAYLSKIRSNRALPGGKIPLGIICSLPSTEERGSAFRQNALAGISVLQNMIQQNQIGSVLVIDNEKMKDYYADNPLKTYAGTEVDAKSYSNMVVSSIVAEVASLPLLQGRSVFDKTEFLSTISTPGWLSISKHSGVADDDDLEKIISALFNENEVLANYEITNALAGAVAIMYPDAKKISPKIADDVYRYSSDLLQTKVNLSISTNSKLDDIRLYGLTVLPSPSIRIQQIKEELDQWIVKEKEQEEAKRQAASSLELDKYGDFFSNSENQYQKRKKLTIDDLNSEDEKEEPAAKASIEDLDNLF